MTDEAKALVERLRSVDISWSETGEWCAEAADRIEELESWKAAEEAHHHMLRQELASLTAEVERLREALEWYVAEDEKYIRAALGGETK